MRIPDPLWMRFAVAARAQRTNRSAVVRDFLRWYVGTPGAVLPERPSST